MIDATEEKDVKPDRKPSKRVTVTLTEESGRILSFKVKLGSNFETVKNMYTSKSGLEKSTVRFVYFGERVDDQTKIAEEEVDNDPNAEEYGKTIHIDIFGHIDGGGRPM